MEHEKIHQIRLAKPDDAPEILKIIRLCFPNHLFKYTIFDCGGITKYIGDSIKAQKCGGASIYTVCLEEGKYFGFAELRKSFQKLFLNHIYVIPLGRKKGVGKNLFLTGINLVKNDLYSSILLDVFSENDIAKKWYQSLGFRCLTEINWVLATFRNKKQKKQSRWRLVGLPQADIVHSAYGFSQFVLETTSSRYEIGRLGTSFYRSTSGDILSDKSAIDALYSIDPKRKLICIGRNNRINTVETINSEIIATCHRLSNRIKPVIKKLAVKKNRMKF
jgi:ribosomal protein S18 acetylase RimI-like enzyme